MSRIDIGQNILKPKVVEATAEGFYKAADDKKTGRICAELADMLEQNRRGELADDDYKTLKAREKRGCWFYTPHAHFRGGYKRSDGDPVDSGKAVIDLDGCEHFEQLYEERLKGRERELGVNMVNISVSKTGGHVLFDIPEGMTRQQAQAWMAQEVLGGVAYDKAVHELERAIFIPCREYILYIDEERMFEAPLSPPEGGTIDKRAERTRERAERTREETGGTREKTGAGEACAVESDNKTAVESDNKTAVESDNKTAVESDNKTAVESDNKTAVESDNKTIVSPSGDERGAFPTSYHGIPFTEILKRYWELNNHGYEPTEGDRDTLTYQLASDLRHICGKNFEWLDQVIPCYNGFTLKEKQQKIRNALESKYEGMPSRLKAVLDSFAPSLSSKGGAIDPADKATVVPSGSEGVASDAPDPLPSRLPKLIRLLTSNTPEVYKAAVAHAVFPALATHLCDVRFRYTDGVDHEATLMNCLMAGTGAGKGCIDEPIRHIMADIKRRDEENLRREAEWKKDCQKKGANKDKMMRPEGLVIQIIDPDMTKPALVTRMDEAEGHFVYVKLNELDLFEQLRGQTGKQHFQLMCLAFDPGAEYGQTRIGTQSVTARPVCRFNWNACTTLLKGRRFFARVLTDGPISRINFCTIPEQEIGAEQPVYGQYDAAFDEALKPYIDNLVAARGQIDCPQATRLARKLQQECAEFARLSQSEVYWNLSHRACVIAWLKACVLYAANGQKWERAIEEFVHWSLQYDLWCKMQFFGEAIERANNGDDARIGTRGPRNLLELLPEEFTIDDAKRVRQQQGLSCDLKAVNHMIRTWKNRGYCAQRTEHSFLKLMK